MSAIPAYFVMPKDKFTLNTQKSSMLPTLHH